METIATIATIVIVGLLSKPLEVWARDIQFRRAPELEQIPTIERQAVWDSAWKDGGFGGIWFVACFAGFLSLLAAVTAFERSAPSPLSTGIITGLIHGSMFALPVVWLIPFGFVSQKRIARGIRCELNRRGYPVCVTCGYVLRDLESPRCPECGTEFAADACTFCGGRGEIRPRLFDASDAILILIAVVLGPGALSGAPYAATFGLIAATAIVSECGFIVAKMARRNSIRCPHCAGAGRLVVPRKWEPRRRALSDSAQPPAPSSSSSIDMTNSPS